ASAVLAFDAACLAARFPVSSSKTEGPGPNISAFNIELSYMDARITKARMEKFKTAMTTSSSNGKMAIINYVDSVNPAQFGSLQGWRVVCKNLPSPPRWLAM